MDKPISEFLREPTQPPPTLAKAIGSATSLSLAEAIGPATFLSLAKALGPQGRLQSLPHVDVHLSSVPPRSTRDIVIHPRHHEQSEMLPALANQ